MIHSEQEFIQRLKLLRLTCAFSEQNILDCIEYLYDQAHKHPDSFETQVLRSLRKLEEHLTTQDDVLKRLQDDSASLKQQVIDLQAAQNAMAQSLADANTRLENDIEALKNQIGSGNVAALTDIATSMESNLATLKTIQTGLETTKTAEDAVDPVPLTSLTVSPLTVSVAPGAQQQFTANMPATWGATSGSIDTNGLYTAPATAGSDVVTATSMDQKQTATASVTVG